MVLLVLLLFCSCLGCLREGVWTKYTPADAARWKAQSADETAVPRLPTQPHRLDVRKRGVELANPERPKRTQLALESQQRLEHEPSDSRLERVSDNIRAGRFRPEICHRETSL